MGINTENDEGADIQIGSTDQGMVRLFVFSDKVELPLDFSPEDAREIAAELISCAEAAEKTAKSK